MLLEFLALLALALYLLYRWATKDQDFFSKRGVAYNKPFPLFGSMKDAALRKRSMFDVVIGLYREQKGSMYGIFDQRLPLFQIKDPELLKQITVKDFDHFVNHRTIFGDDSGNNLFANSLFFMRDAKWKDMRSTLSPAFTGSKMRQMFQLINQVAQDSVLHLKRKQGINTKAGHELELKSYCTRFTSDVIASTAFGLQVNSFEQENNEFYLMGKKVTTFNVWANIKFLLFLHCKKLVQWLKIDIFGKAATAYFMRLVLDAMKYRKEHNISRPDMINMLMEARGMLSTEPSAKPSHNQDWSDVEIVAQCFLFFFAGFETASVLICFAAHELMENPATQEKLLQEIAEVNSKLEGKPITYEALQGMKYMDMVVSEVLRKWPAAVAIDRVCNKAITYEIGGKPFDFKVGDNLWIPVAGFHRDPKYFENPDKFDPERFSEENKHNIMPFTYMPFGLGPRNCIGSRFALLEAKAILYYLIRDFRIEMSPKTSQPMVLSAKSFQLMPKNGFWMKLLVRDQA